MKEKYKEMNISIIGLHLRFPLNLELKSRPSFGNSPISLPISPDSLINLERKDERKI
jgi:hypothetical protein